MHSTAPAFRGTVVLSVLSPQCSQAVEGTDSGRQQQLRLQSPQSGIHRAHSLAFTEPTVWHLQSPQSGFRPCVQMAVLGLLCLLAR
jgi:hypothetical protein